MSDTDTSDTERKRLSLVCLVFGHDWYSELTWQLQNDASVRKLWGDVCQRCHKFQPRHDGKERYVDADTEQSAGADN